MPTESGDNKLLGNFRKLIQTFLELLALISTYAPNEEELKISSLRAFVADLKAKNDAVGAAYVPLNRARGKRDPVCFTRMKTASSTRRCW